MKTLIIGGTGLISSFITKQLVERKIHVTHYNRGRSEARFAKPDAVITGDRKDYAAFERQMKDAGPFDCVIDMIGFEPEDGKSLIRAFAGTTKQVVFCSTVDVYERPYHYHPVREDHLRKGPNSYGEKKRLIENMLFEAHGSGEFNVTIIRPAHTYGEGGGIIHPLGWNSAFIDRVRRGMPVVVHGDGMSLWGSCYADDVAAAFARAVGNKAASGKAYHTASDEWVTWNRYVQTAALAMGAPVPKIVHIPSDLLAAALPHRCSILLENFQHDNVFDNSAARKDLGFKCTVSLLEGMKRTYEYMKEKNQIEGADKDPAYDKVIAAWEKAEKKFKEEAMGADW